MEMQMQEKPKSSMFSGKDSVEALRAAVELEIKSKKQCAYQSYECTQLTLDGFNYCMKHILQDKSAPYKQCAFVYTSNGKRCQLAAPKGEKKDYGYCSEHALKTTLARNRQNARYPPPQTAEVLLHSLAHYVKKPRNRALSSSSAQLSEDGGRRTPDESIELKATKSLDPFNDLDASSIFNAKCNDILDLCSESESDIEGSTFSAVWHDAHADSSDNESIDSDQEDILKHANVYTAEEITMITKEKLIRLQSLYVEQYRQLQHMLRERRRKYLHALKREKETCCNIYTQVRDNPKEQRLYKKLKAYNKYQKSYGVEAILNKQLHEMRAQITEGNLSKPPSHTKCCFTEGGVKCGEKTLPLAKYCRKHILEDPNQVLFKSCGKVKADVECSTPVEAIFEDATCKLHMEVPVLRSYNQVRKDSESDMDDSIEPAHLFTTVKSEVSDMLTNEIPKMDKVPTMLFEESHLDQPFFEAEDDVMKEDEETKCKKEMDTSVEETMDTDGTETADEAAHFLTESEPDPNFNNFPSPKDPVV